MKNSMLKFNPNIEFFVDDICIYFLPTRDMTKIIKAMTATTRNIPTPIPALNTPFTTEQLATDIK